MLLMVVFIDVLLVGYANIWLRCRCNNTWYLWRDITIFLYTHFEGCNDGKLEGLEIGDRYGVNDGVGLCVSGGLVTGFDVGANVLTLGIDEIITNMSFF